MIHRSRITKYHMGKDNPKDLLRWPVLNRISYGQFVFARLLFHLTAHTFVGRFLITRRSTYHAYPFWEHDPRQRAQHLHATLSKPTCLKPQLQQHYPSRRAWNFSHSNIIVPETLATATLSKATCLKFEPRLATITLSKPTHTKLQPQQHYLTGYPQL